jgi:predicted O-methyltransferase YrrM
LISASFGYASKIKSLLPAIHFNSKIPIQVVEVFHKDGNISITELLIISQLVKERNPKKIFEIGTFDGRTTINMAMNCSNDTQLFTLDLPMSSDNNTKYPLAPYESVYVKKPQPGVRFASYNVAKKIKQLLGDSARFDYTPYLNSIDLVFIDGSHALEYVKNDTEIALKLLNDQKGVILWHDCGVWDDVTGFLNEKYLNDPLFSGIRLIKDTSLAVLTL